MDEARSLGFPVFEVPYELPFIALTEKAFARLVNEQYEVLQRGIAIHKRLERLVLEERGLDELVRALSASIGGTVMVLDGHGDALAERAFRRPLSAEAMAFLRDEIRARGDDAAREGDGAEFTPDHPDLAGRSLVLPVATRGAGAPHAWLVATRDAGGLGDFERLILQQAATVVALELMRQRAMRDTERRLAGDVLDEALTGHPGRGRGGVAAAAVRRGRGRRRAGVRLARPDRRRAAARPPPARRRRGRPGGLARADALRRGERTRRRRPRGPRRGRARGARRRRPARGGQPAAPVGALRRSFHEARCALEAAALANGTAPEVASYRDLGAFQLLLSLQDDEALRLYCDSVLGPLEDGGGEYGDELIRSLEAFIEQNGQWEKAARELFCHRHTLRYRIRRVEELTGRDLKSARDRIEFWLALRARELVA